MFIQNLMMAYGLDILLGDPQRAPHPVRLIGFFINRGEKFFRKYISSEFVAGSALTISLTAFSFCSTFFFLKFLSNYSTILQMIAEIFLLYSSLSTKDLAVESFWVKDALESRDILLARKKLSWIVGRDTDKLDEKEIVRATVETVAENTVDGIIAPIFYAVIGGAPLAIAYKTINTLDSMIGHKDEKYIRFGKIAAILDTWANWVPSRIAGVLFPIAAWILNFSTKNSYETAWRQGAKTDAPNSAIPEGAVAGALSIQLGGTNFYKGQIRNTPVIGNDLRPVSIQNIGESIRMMYVVSFIFFLFGLGARFLIEK